MIDLSHRNLVDLCAGAPRLQRASAAGVPPVLVAGLGSTSPATLASLQREYAFRAALHEDWAAVPQALLPAGEGAVLVLADPGGEPLRLDGAPCPPLGSFFATAIRLASALAAMHAAGVVHRALAPQRFLMGADGTVRLTGFGFAMRLEGEDPAPADAGLEWDEDSFLYMAPELGARMNTRVDQRADLYALGCILHQMLVGAPPLNGADAAARVHAHATRQPRSPHEIDPRVPELVAQLVMKLLEKAPEHRFPNADSLIADLRRCEALWHRFGDVPHFALDSNAALQRLQRAERVLGREQELEAVLAGYRDVDLRGRARVVWIAGPSGIGKSTVLHEAFARIQHIGAPLLAASKSEEGRRAMPYAALVQALDPLLQWVLGLPEAEFAHWRERIRHAAAPVDRTLAAFLPALAKVLGPPPDAPEASDTSPALERERVLKGMARLVACFASRARPLVLLLDDLQWTDVGSLQVLERLLHPRAETPLLLIGAFRSDEVGADHPLRAGSLAAVPEAVRIELGPLDDAALRELIAATLRQDAGTLAPLAALIGRRTQRNPFFVLHLLRLLAEEGLLAYDAETADWRWSLERIAAHHGVANVVELFARRLEQLPGEARAMLRVLACLGHRASTKALAVAAALPLPKAVEGLQAALEAGTLHREGDDWIFRHDRIRETTYASIPAAELAPLHLTIARRLMSHAGAAVDVFALAAQANFARSAVDDARERSAFARLNLEAGRQAKAATAHHSALEFFRAALDFLGHEDTSVDGLAARMLCGEAEFMTGALAAAEARLSALEAVAGDGIFGADLTRLRAALYTTLGRFDLALASGLAFLRKAGIDIPPDPDDADVDREYARLRGWLDAHDIAELRTLPLVTDPFRRAITDIFADLIPPALYSNQNLVDLIVLRMANLDIVHGHADASADGYSCMNQVFGVRYGDYATARAFGELSLFLVDRRGLRKYRGRVYMAFGTIFVPWMRPAGSARDYIRRAYDVAVQSGDHTFAIYCGRNEATGMLFAGDFLGDVRETVVRGLALARDANFQLVIDALLAQVALLDRLMDGVHDGSGELQPPSEDAPATLVDFAYWVYRLQGALLFGDLADALESRRRADACAHMGRSFAESGDLPFYGALALLAVEGRDARQEADLLRHARQLEVFAEACPENFIARRDLVRAEMALAAGHVLEAASAFSNAVSHARRHRFTQVEALAAERAAHFHLARGDEIAAIAYLRHARGAWQRWGATAKALHLQHQHPALAEAAPMSPNASRLRELDVQAVLSISNALASDIEPARLVETLMRTALESAGAGRGALALLRDGLWQVPARAEVVEGAIVVAQDVLPFTTEAVPVSLLQAVARTHESVVLDDARDAPALARDDYIRRRQPRSVLCVPLMRHAALVGVLYLENNLATRVFTTAKAALLEVIASQAAFALENGRLYDELRAQSEQRARTEEQLRAAIAELERASRLKAMGELVASIVHEVGQPLAAVDTSASAGLRWLNRTPPDIDEARQMLTHIGRSATRAKTIIQGLRAKARKAEPSFTTLDLADALREAAALVAGQLDALQVELTLQGLDAPVPVHGDRIQLQQVAINLLVNGAESMAASHAGPRPLVLACAVDGDARVRVAVEDRGSGIDPAVADRLLEPLFTTKDNGMGMGLAISRSILEAHGGLLSLSPRVGGGTCAVFTLPRLNVADPSCPLV